MKKTSSIIGILLFCIISATSHAMPITIEASSVVPLDYSDFSFLADDINDDDFIDVDEILSFSGLVNFNFDVTYTEIGGPPFFVQPVFDILNLSWVNNSLLFSTTTPSLAILSVGSDRWNYTQVATQISEPTTLWLLLLGAIGAMMSRLISRGSRSSSFVLR